MFDIDKWQEIFSTIKKNKLRTFLTGFSVAWGIFMLIVLLGSGYGLENEVRRQFEDDGTNIIGIHRGTTSIAHKGFQAGRLLAFTNEDFEYLSKIQNVDRGAGRFTIAGSLPVSYKNEYGNFNAILEHIAPKGVEENGAIQFEIKANVELKPDLFIRTGYSANAAIVLEETKGEV